jgi:hypothetical protein
MTILHAAKNLTPRQTQVLIEHLEIAGLQSEIVFFLAIRESVPAQPLPSSRTKRLGAGSLSRQDCQSARKRGRDFETLPARTSFATEDKPLSGSWALRNAMPGLAGRMYMACYSSCPFWCLPISCTDEFCQAAYAVFSASHLISALAVHGLNPFRGAREPFTPCAKRR